MIYRIGWMSKRYPEPRYGKWWVWVGPYLIAVRGGPEGFYVA